MNEVYRQSTDRLVGLSEAEAARRLLQQGPNIGIQPGGKLWGLLLSVAGEPMFLLLLCACAVYFFLGELTEAITMLSALCLVAGISVFQDYRSRKAVNALSKMTSKRAKVVREGVRRALPAEDLVVGDLIVCEEGDLIPADATVRAANDFVVNESIITGESAPVDKMAGDDIMQGTLVVRGYCHAEVKATGKNTMLAGIGYSVEQQSREKTPLQQKVARFVRLMALAGSLAFFFVWAYYSWETGSMVEGLLYGLAMAMSVLPEEIPVALSTFMALGAYRLLRHGVIARGLNAVETLGSATVICVDKTGTLTQNLMRLALAYDAIRGQEISFENGEASPTPVLEYAMWASEEAPFDPMEKSLHAHYAAAFAIDERGAYRMVMEFPLSGSPPVMTHVFANSDQQLKIGGKGGLESILRLSSPDEATRREALEIARSYASRGLRVLGVAQGLWRHAGLPRAQEDIEFRFLGIVAFADPPDPHIREVIQHFHDAGLIVKMITGDSLETALAVAREVGIPSGAALSGGEVASLAPEALRRRVDNIHVFARMFPEAKLKVIEALKANGEVVAMTGDGVNDAPALKAAHIGVAMGKRGAEVAKHAAGLVLARDNLGRMVEAIMLGRRINVNLRKAIRYIISIHIPIILLVAMPIFSPWLPPMLFGPVHVIFLELIMGPTCSIIYENEPANPAELRRPYLQDQRSLFSADELGLTILQGLAITVACLFVGYHAAAHGDGAYVRACIFSTLVFANVFLTLVNRSFTQSIAKTIRMKNRLIPVVIFLSLALLAAILYLPFFNGVFNVVPLGPAELLMPFLAAILAVFWVEPWKIWKAKAG
jgi:Ca2+-transporting ATPase